MKKVISSCLIVLASCVVLSSCIKNTPYITTINPTMTATIGEYKFISSAVKPSTIDTQIMDTSTTLVITGYTSDRVDPYDKIILSIANFKSVTGTFSIVQGQAYAVYYHGILTGRATGGIVAVTEVTTTTASGYFNFTTDDGLKITNGKYTVGLP